MFEELEKIKKLSIETNFYEYDIYLKAKDEKEINLKELSVGLNRFVIKLFELGNKDLISTLKNINDLKPFRITFLEKTDKNDTYKFKLFILNSALNSSFLKSINNYNTDIDLNYNQFSLIGYEKIKEENIENIFIKVLENIHFNKIRIKFLSETTFRRKSSSDKKSIGQYPFPDINTIFFSLINKWNKLIPDEFSIFQNVLLKEISKSIYQSSANIKVRVINLGYSEKQKIYFSGFIGDSLIGIKTKDIQFKKHIIALLIFGEWSGLGKKTSFGMGNIKVCFLE